MFSVAENQIVTMQYSVVCLLAIITFQAASAFKEPSFRLVGFAWLFNLAYLLTSNNSAGAAALMLTPNHVTLPSIFFDFLASGSFWYAAHKGGRSNQAVYLSFLGDSGFLVVPLSLFLISSVFIILLPPGAYQNYFVSTLPEVILDMSSLLALSCFFRDRANENDGVSTSDRGWLLFVGTRVYSAIQILQLFAFGPHQGQVRWLGFSLGLVAKISIFFGTIQLLVTATRTSITTAAEKRRVAEVGLKINLLSHELATPISEILAWVGDLGRPSSLANATRRIESAASRASALLVASRLTLREESEPPSGIRREPGEAALQTAISEEPQRGDELNSWQPINVNTLIEIAQSSVKATRTEGINFRHQYSRSCCVECIPNEIIQILINLIRNSYDALHSERGIIDLRTLNDRSTELEQTQFPHGRVKIVVRDDGEGVSEENISKLYDLGFTTRAGAGRGHGLAVVRDLVEKNNGTIEFNSPPPNSTGTKGTEVILSFPRVSCDFAQESEPTRGRTTQ